jgi:hypothetical protein
MNTLQTILVAGPTLIVGLLAISTRSLMSAFGEEKGKNLATRGDTQKILDHLVAVPKTTKEIMVAAEGAHWLDREPSRLWFRPATIFQSLDSRKHAL